MTIFRPIRLSRLVLLLLIGIPLLLGIQWDGFQMESAFGQARAADQRVERSAYWTADPAPVGLNGREDLPPLQALIYNLHSGLGTKWRLFAPREKVEKNLRAIARRIAEAASAGSPIDVIGLNEVDFHSRRSGWIDQADYLVRELHLLTGQDYRVVRGETWRRDLPGLEVRFGNAILVRHPVLDGQNCQLEPPRAGEAGAVKAPVGGLLSRICGEPRGVVRATIDFHGEPLDVLVTHLEAFVLSRREAQAAEILRLHARTGRSTVLLGDTNAVPSAMTVDRSPFAADRTHDILASGHLIDARVSLAARQGANDLSDWATYPARDPRWPLDAVFATADLLPRAAQVVGTDESDHRGLLVRYEWLDAAAAKEQARWHDALRRRQLEQILSRDFRTAEPGSGRRADWLAAATGFGDILVEISSGLREPMTR